MTYDKVSSILIECFVTDCHMGGDCMPTETFYNLPMEKKERIRQAIAYEITEKGFANASINQIIQKANISRGSFYQYFLNKEDMTRYIISELTKNMQEFLHQAIVKNQGEIFKSFEDMLLSIVNFVNADSKLSAFHRSIFADHVLNNQFCSKEGKEIVLQILFKELEPYKEKWAKGKSRKEICLLLDMILDISGRTVLDTFLEGEKADFELIKAEYCWKLGILREGFV